MATQLLLCNSKNDKRVTYDPIHSHAATHLEDTPQLKALVIEAIEGMILEEDIMKDINMGRVIGTTDVVEVNEMDEVVYGIRKNREDEGHVPFTKSRPGNPSSCVSLQLVKKTNGTYELTSAWIGTFEDDDEPFPNSPLATSRSKDFWSKHAFVYGSQEIQTGTETAKCPW